MLYIDEEGYIDAERIIVKIFKAIERGSLVKVNGIIVHQTNSPTANSTFNSYKNAGANGAHFLIDKEGVIYQTASLFKTTWHVGKIQSRCYLTKKCDSADLEKITSLSRSWGNFRQISEMEKQKKFPDRFPDNSDSIGIEIVGLAIILKEEPNPVFEPVNELQNASLKWLIKELAETLKVSMTEVYRHPEIARKNATEAKTAQWEN